MVRIIYGHKWRILQEQFSERNMRDNGDNVFTVINKFSVCTPQR